MNKIWLKNKIDQIKVEIGVSAILIVLLSVFTIINPKVFLDFRLYTAVLISLPVLIILSASSVFVIATGEIDLSFPSTFGIGGWFFAMVATSGVNQVFGLFAALAIGAFIGLINGLIVTKLKLSSLVSTLGMLFLLRGALNMILKGDQISLISLKGSLFFKVFIYRINDVFPVQMLWAIIIVIFLWVLFYRHRFGGYVMYVGDNSQSAKESGVNVDGVKIATFILLGTFAGFCGVLSVLINSYFWPTLGDSIMLTVLASVFLGGTPVGGGKGTIYGALIGAVMMGFIDSGIVGAGLSGYYTQFFYGLIIILALIGHKFLGLRK